MDYSQGYSLINILMWTKMGKSFIQLINGDKPSYIFKGDPPSHYLACTDFGLCKLVSLCYRCEVWVFCITSTQVLVLYTADFFSFCWAQGSLTTYSWGRCSLCFKMNSSTMFSVLKPIKYSPPNLLNYVFAGDPVLYSCPPGHYCDGIPGSDFASGAGPRLCPLYTHRASPGAGSKGDCLPCPPGSYCNSTGKKQGIAHSGLQSVCITNECAHGSTKAHLCFIVHFIFQALRQKW